MSSCAVALRGSAVRIGTMSSKCSTSFSMPDDGDVDLRQRGDQAGVAFVGDDDDAAGLGHGDVGAGDAHVGVQEVGPQLAARELHQLRDVRRLAGLRPRC